MSKPRARLVLDVPLRGAEGDETQIVAWEPQVISLKWSKNHHRAADELVVTIGWMEGGLDPRMLKHARCDMWLWDDDTDVFDEIRHLRFKGICKKSTRRLGSDGYVVELLFHDYTTFFLMMKPFPSDGMPEWSDTLGQAWGKICDYTGWRQPNGKIKSSVSDLKSTIRFIPAELGTKTLGEMVPERFHQNSKPTPSARTDAWSVWQYCCAAIALVSYIDRGEVIVTVSNEYFKEETAPVLLYGREVLTFEESADTHVIAKGILGKSFDHLRGVRLEAAWPGPDDPFIKKSRAVVKRSINESRGVSLNEVSADYEEYNFPACQTQKALEAMVREAWEEFSRQEMTGKIGTGEMFLQSRESEDTRPIDIMSLGAGDCIHVGMDEEARETLKNTMSPTEAVAYLMDTVGYIRPVAELIAKNIQNRAYESPIFHVETLEVELTPDSFNVDIVYHNRVNLEGLYL